VICLCVRIRHDAGAIHVQRAKPDSVAQRTMLYDRGLMKELEGIWTASGFLQTSEARHCGMERRHDGLSFQARLLSQTLRCVATFAGIRHCTGDYNEQYLQLVARLMLFSMYDAICLELLSPAAATNGMLVVAEPRRNGR
jgi:hypothetical protein